MPITDYALDVQNRIYRAANILVRKSSTNGMISPTSDFINLGHIKDAQVDWSSVVSDPDSAGRSKEHSFDFEINCSLQQTSNTELSNIEELVGDLVDVLFTASPQTGDVTELNAATEAVNGFLVYEVLMLIDGTIDFMGEESMLVMTIPFRVQAKDLSNVPQEPSP